ncbi:peroxide stress protein YaaA [Verrucomicrobiales bacterium BCK34]|nr:peroxide stress protein YaaA [Verrucomicrobiales bacterium BCK34]
MLAVISPAKTLDYESTLPSLRPTQPRLLDQSEALIKVLRKLSSSDLQALMGISEKLGDLNAERNQSWSVPFSSDNARAALFAFKGDVYTGFTLDEYASEDFSFAQKHLRILSGLYGVLRPLDLMQPYRLEMGTALQTSKGKNLYEFWGDQITKELNAAFKASGSNTLVNLASKEYFSAVTPGELKGDVITPNFKDLKNGSYKIISFYAKKARGMMCDYMIRNRIGNPEELKGFDRDGYSFNPTLSKGNDWIFTRDVVPSA